MFQVCAGSWRGLKHSGNKRVQVNRPLLPMERISRSADVDGPWAASDATPFMQYGRHSIAVPTDGAHRFFRLR